MNTYHKYAPNVFVAKCTEQHEKGETINIETKYGKEHECIVFNCVGTSEKDGTTYFYYSIVRADGYNHQEHMKRKAERLQRCAGNADRKSTAYWQASNEGASFLSLGEPIKIGHHSERRHRALIERNHNRMSKSVALSNAAQDYAQRAEYWKAKESEINLSMPESIDFYEYKLEQAKKKHEGLLNGTIERSHSYSLTYAKKDVNNYQDLYNKALKLWS